MSSDQETDNIQYTKPTYNLRCRGKTPKPVQQDVEKPSGKNASTRKKNKTKPVVTKYKDTVSKVTTRRVRNTRPVVKREPPRRVKIEEIEEESDEYIGDTEDDESDDDDDMSDMSDFVDTRDDLLDGGRFATLLANAINRRIDDNEDSDFSDSSDDDRRSKPKKKQEKLYRSIKDYIKNDRPSINKLLQMNIPYKEMCAIFEQIKILDTMGKYSHDYIEYKNNINNRIRQYTKSSIDKREYEKYDKIETNLLKDSSLSMPLKYKILSSNLCEYNKKIVYEKYLTLQTMEPFESSHSKLSEWIEWAISIPNVTKSLKITNKNIDRNRFLTELRTNLDNSLYGMAKAKEEIICSVNDYLTENNSKGHGMALVGSPGIGKTTIVRVLAECLDLPFQQLSLGGVKDASFLTGHSYTYEGAKPGAIVEALRRMKYKNGIIFFDEFDKLADTEKGMEAANVLLHVTDPTQNSEFKDMFLSELKVDLSNIWFIYSMNNERSINPVLRDRIPIIKLPSYKESDKVDIFIKHLFPGALKKYNYTTDDIDIHRSTALHLIQHITAESGVRELKRTIESIVKKIHLLKTCTLRDNTLGGLDLSFDLGELVDVRKKICITTDIIDKFIAKKTDQAYLSMFL